MNILIFSVSIGNGHDQVAHNLRNEFIRINNDSRVKIVNTINFISPILDKVILESYMKILKIYPKAWGKIYETTNKKDPIIDINDITNRLMTSKLKRSINDFKPDVIVCTHSFPASIISSLKQKGQVIYPLLSVITDFNIHSSWINELTDYYIIPHENLTYVMEGFGVGREKILPLGIPIKKEFSLPLDRQAISSSINLDNSKNTILVMGGGLGLGGINKIVKELDQSLQDVQIIAVAGRNNRLETRLQSLATNNKLIVYGFINNIHELMEVADIIITKPGGVSTAEIMCKQKPLIIFSPLPGQEYENAEFLLNVGAAAATSDVKRIPVLIKQIFNFDARMKCIREIMGVLKKPSAAADAASFICQRYDRSKNN